MKSFLLAATLIVPVVTRAQESPDTAHRLVDSLKTGGYVIVFRHAHTDRSKMEQHGWSLADRSTQRNLSDRGAEESVTIGRAFKALGIPIGEVLASPMFRTKETAEHAFGRADTTELLREKRSDPASRALLTRPVPAGSNRVLVTHNAYFHTFFETAGFMQNGEGDAVIVRPLGDEGFQVLGRIRIADWQHFASVAPGEWPWPQRRLQ
jgi:phosphohistidine phosphatase SixA